MEERLNWPHRRAELWDASGRDIARLEPGKKWHRIRGTYVSDTAGNSLT